jgi:hypothetical protein
LNYFKNFIIFFSLYFFFCSNWFRIIFGFINILCSISSSRFFYIIMKFMFFVMILTIRTFATPCPNCITPYSLELYPSFWPLQFLWHTFLQLLQFKSYHPLLNFLCMFLHMVLIWFFNCYFFIFTSFKCLQIFFYFITFISFLYWYI